MGAGIADPLVGGATQPGLGRVQLLDRHHQVHGRHLRAHPSIVHRTPEVDLGRPARKTLDVKPGSGGSWVRREKGGFWIAFCAVFFYPTAWLVGRSRFEGKEHIPPTGGALMVANHISHLDPIFSGLVVHRARRVPRFLAKHSLWGAPVLGSALRGSG